MTFDEVNHFYNFMEALNIKASFFCAGTDEAGRGPLAGPVVGACAYIECSSFDEFRSALNFLESLGVNDSKKLSSKKRKEILKNINIKLKQAKSISGSLGPIKLKAFAISEKKIDEINILQASLKAMKDSFKSLVKNEVPGVVLVDGNKIFKLTSPKVIVSPLVKGDSKSKLIGIASIVAKEFRDYLMEKFDETYPQYGFKKHSGYPTREHKKAIEKFGPCSIHRKSFRGVKEFF